MRLVVFLSVLFFGLPAGASTVTLDFESDYTQLEGFPDALLETKGYLLTNVGVTNGAPYAAVGPSHTLVTLSQVSGDAFAISSVDLQSGFGSYLGEWQITGNYASGGSIAKSVDITSFETVTFDSSWIDLQSVTFFLVDPTYSFPGQLLDNVVVSSVVPIPAAVWLFGSALAGLGWMRQKKTS